MEKYIGVLSAIVIGCAQLIYLLNTWKKRVTPSVLSWLGWAFLMGTSLVAQTLSKGWQWSLASLGCSTVGCLLIALVAWGRGNFSFHPKDLRFLALGLVCMVIYGCSDNPWMTTIFAIIADALLGIPTLRKAWREPKQERSSSWILGMVSSGLALSICFDHSLIYALFPAYLFAFNGTMTCFTFLLN